MVYPHSHFTLYTGSRYLCPPEKSVQQHSITSQRVGVGRHVSPTHGPQAPTSWHCCAGRRQAQGDWAWTHSSGQVAECPWCQVSQRAFSADSKPIGLPCPELVSLGLLGLSMWGSSPWGFGWPIRWCCLGQKRGWERWGRFVPWQEQDGQKQLSPGGKTIWFMRKTHALYGESGKK